MQLNERLLVVGLVESWTKVLLVGIISKLIPGVWYARLMRVAIINRI